MRRLSVLGLVALLAGCNTGCGGNTAGKGSEAPADPPLEASESLPDLPQLERDPREPTLAAGLKLMLETEHLRRGPVNDDISKQAFAEYLERLDPGKLFLLEDHADKLRHYADKMDDQLTQGDLRLGRMGSAMMASRQKIVARAVADILSKPFDFTIDESLDTDTEKRPFAADEAELRDRWRKALKLQVLEQLARMDEIKENLEEAIAKGEDAKAIEAMKKTLADVPATPEAREEKARKELAESFEGRFKRLEHVESLEPSEAFLNALTAIYDPHTLYLPPAEKDNFDIQMSGTLEGIGAVLSEDDHYIAVREIVPGGASWRQGELEAGDLILSVAQEGKEAVDVGYMRINQVVQMIRGPKGTTVTLTVQKADDSIKVIRITRDVVEIEAAYARGGVIRRKGARPIGYLSLPSFYGNTRSDPGATRERNAAEDVKELLGQLQKRGVDGVIVDLRGNGGGLLEHARLITGMFIATGPVVQTQFPNEESQVLRDEDASIDYDGKVVVLVDRFSASASEILAGALQDYKRAVIVGTSPTHGKGTVQMLLDLSRLGSSSGKPLGVLKMSIQQFYRVNGESTQWRGVVPDITLPDPTAHIESGERYLDHAIPWSSTKALKYTPWPKATWNLSELDAASKARQAKDSEFSLVTKRAALFQARKDEHVVPLEMGKWMERRKALRAEVEALGTDDDKRPPRFDLDVVRFGHVSGDAKAEASRIADWKKSLTSDPWVDEAAHILSDM